MTESPTGLQPRLLDVQQCAVYLGNVSEDQVHRLINPGVLSVVRLPASRSRTGAPSRRVLIDRLEVDALVGRWREKRT